MEIKLRTEYITLGQFLKIADIISTGGEAKFALQELDIYVNGEKENRRGKKLYPNDEVIVEQNTYYIK